MYGSCNVNTVSRKYSNIIEDTLLIYRISDETDLIVHVEMKMMRVPVRFVVTFHNTCSLRACAGVCARVYMHVTDAIVIAVECSIYCHQLHVKQPSFCCSASVSSSIQRGNMANEGNWLLQPVLWH